jgi:hypothetical protein
MSTAPNGFGPGVVRSRAWDRMSKSWFERRTSWMSAVAGRPNKSFDSARTTVTESAMRASCWRRSLMISSLKVAGRYLRAYGRATITSTMVRVAPEFRARRTARSSAG